MVKRLFDVLASFIAIILVSPVLLLAFLSVRIASPGPAIYRAQRIGRGGTPFVMHKFRTMHVRHATGSVITSAKDSRIFLAGKILRALKIDELPQLFDVLAGRMSIVGPRPEDPKIVELYYTPLARETLSVAPGLSSPGSVHYYTSSELHVDDGDPEQFYVTRLLPIKLAMDIVYLRHGSLWYDLTIIAKTAVTIMLVGCGKRKFAEPREFSEAQLLMNNADAPLVRLSEQQEL
jgi:lipopolysaccharide/colanic/teichoic acid biosynthesis glycosyltransferase